MLPAPWWEWNQEHLGAGVGTPHDYHGLWRNRLDARCEVFALGSEHWWVVRDEGTARRAGEDVVQQLRAEALPLMLGLLDREVLIDAVRHRDLGFFKGEGHQLMFDKALAALLTDDGRSDELDAVLDRIQAMPEQHTAAARQVFVQWARSRAAAR